MKETRNHKKKIIISKQVLNGIRCSIGTCKAKGTHYVTMTTFLSIQSSLCNKHFAQFKNEANNL